MNMPDRSYREPSPAPRYGCASLQFAAWWCAFYCLVVLLAWAEGIRLRHLGLRYASRHAFGHVGVRELRVAADRQWAVAVMGFRVSLFEAAVVPDVVLYDFDRQTARRLDLAHLVPRRVAMSPRGDSLVIASDCSVHVTARPSGGADGHQPVPGAVRLLYRVCDDGIQNLVFSPDGRQLAAVGERHIHWLRYPEGEPVRRLTLEHPWAQVTFSKDSQHLIVFGVDRQVRWYATPSGRHVDSQWLTAAGAVRTVLSAGGRLAAHVESDGALSVWDVAANRELWRHLVTVPAHHAHTRTGFSPDGRLLAVACDADAGFQIHCHDALTGIELGRSMCYPKVCKGLVVTDDGVIYSWDMEGVIRTWNVTGGVEQWCFAWPDRVSRMRVPLKHVRRGRYR